MSYPRLYPALLLLTAGLLFAADPASGPDPEGALVVVDHGGRKRVLASWEFREGIQPVAWLAQGKKEGPPALAFRDSQSTNFVAGITTYLPVEHLRSIDYDRDKETVTVHVAGETSEKDLVLSGPTKYRRVNKLAIVAEEEWQDRGIAELRFQGGVPEGIRGVRFPTVKPAPLPEGKPVTITVADKAENIQKVVSLQALYRLADGSERLDSALHLPGGMKLGLDRVLKGSLSPGTKRDEAELKTTLTGGEEQTATLSLATTIDGKPATLLGLVGRIPGGYRLYPLHTIRTFEQPATP